MQFAGSIDPLQWILAGLVPPAIFLLYFLKLKRKRLMVPTTFLWKKSIEDLHVNSLWQKLRRNILLLLQLLFAFLALGALARPIMQKVDMEARSILIIDNSASMSTADVKPSRLAQAKQRAREIVDTMTEGNAAMVIASSDTAKVMTSYTQNKAELRAAIDRIEQTARRTNHREAMTIASGLANPHKSGEDNAEALPATLFMISDGRFEPISDVPLGNLNLKFLTIGAEKTPNLAITTLAARPNERNPEIINVFGKVRNFSSQQIETTAELLLNDQRIDLQRLSIPANADTPMSFRLSTQESGILQVKLETGDMLPLDNTAWTVLSPPKRANVLVIGDAIKPIKAVFETARMKLLSIVEYRLKSAATDIEMEGNPDYAKFDLVVFYRCSPKSMPDTSTLMIGQMPPKLATVETKVSKFPGILNWSTTHPALRFLQLDDVNITEAVIPTSTGSIDVLIESDQGPLLFAMQRGPFTDLVQTFSLVDDQENWLTDWPIRTSFPLFFMNIVRAVARTDADNAGQLRPGDAFSIRAELQNQATVTTPSGKATIAKPLSNGRIEWVDTNELGIYKVDLGKESYSFAVNLFDEAESNIEPKTQVTVGAETAADSSMEVSSHRELWWWLALVAFMLLLLEWWVYNKRVHV